jgi:predicted RNase H-like nuclease
MAVQLSDALRRSGAVAADAPMLVDSSCATQPWEAVAAALSALVSHACYYWAAEQRGAAQANEQLARARERLAEKEQALSRAAAIAVGLKSHASGRAHVPWRARGRAREGDGLMAADIVSP